MNLNSACVQIKLNENILDILTLNSTNLKSLLTSLRSS